MITLSEIAAGFEKGEFFLEYQPVMSLKENRCVGGEALIRWRRGARVIPPMDFIPLVENTYLSGTMTYWVVDKVAEEFGAWLREHQDVHIAINVPPEVFGRGGVRYAAEKANLLSIANKFLLEVTERGVPDRLGIEELNDAYNTGVLIALDDAYVNDANLVVMSRVRFDIVKIDKSFADQMLRDDWAPEKISGLATLIRTTNLKVVIEGVEEAAQIEILRAAGVDLVQGWYFSRSLSAADFKTYFSANGGRKIPI